MPTVAVIPARGGSKGIPGKNLANVGGRPLVQRAIEACQASERCDIIGVSTDDDEIAATARDCGARVIERPDALSGDVASSESALLHALDVLSSDGDDADVLVFVQCTSPFIDPGDLAQAIDAVASGHADVAFAARESFEFLWTANDDGSVTGLNHDASTRLRRQERTPCWSETGAFYVMDAAGFRAHQHRFFGRTVVQPVDPTLAVEIDTPGELELARALADRHDRGAVPRLDGVRLLVTDFDGVHTDDRVWVGQDGVEFVAASRSDGHGIALLRREGIEVFILSTEKNPVVARRAEKLGVECMHGVDDKWVALRKLLAERDVDPSDVAYVGNDVNDLECIANVGHGMAVADAIPSVRDAARYVTSARGGAGAVREIADLLLASRGHQAPG